MLKVSKKIHIFTRLLYKIMTELIKVACDNTGEIIEVMAGSTLRDVELQLNMPNKNSFLAAYVNNRVKELSYKIYRPITIRFVDITTFEGLRVYRRTATFVLQKALHDLYPSSKLHIRHTLGNNSGFYCNILGDVNISEIDIDAIKRRMDEIIDLNIDIDHSMMLTKDVREAYAKFNYDDKIALLDTRPRLYSKIYTLDDIPGYFYGSLAPSTGYVNLFDLKRYYNGICLLLPKNTAPEALEPYIQQDKMFDIFQEYQSWVDIMGVSTAGELNSKVMAGDASELIKIAEAFHEKKLASIADAIDVANRESGTRMVLISGPSSSGKTTFAKRLGIHLRVLGLNPVLISLDDYFVDREKSPIDENGEYDFEALEAIDLVQFNDHLQRLNSGESVDIPRYDFISGRRKWHNNPLTLDRRSILIIEGIHGLNPRLTQSMADNLKFKIYISCFTSVAMDNVSRISTTDNRLLRRLIRDYSTRGADALATLSRWDSVRRGEEKNIFPYQEGADIMFNSSLFYEISVLRSFAEPILNEVTNIHPEYDKAQRMLKFLDNFIPIQSHEIPPTSIIREIIGGSSFKY